MTGAEREELVTARVILDLAVVYLGQGRPGDAEIARGLVADATDRIGRLLWPMSYVGLGAQWADDESGGGDG